VIEDQHQVAGMFTGRKYARRASRAIVAELFDEADTVAAQRR